MEHILFDDFNRIINALNDGIFISDAAGNYLAINDSAAKIEKIRKEDYIGANVRDLISDRIFSEDDCVTLAVLRTEKAQNWYRDDYKGRNVMINGFPIFKDGRLYRIVVQLREISSIIDLQQKLNSVSLENKRMLDELAIVQEQSRRDGSIIYQGKAVERIYDLCLRIAKVETTVLLTGESGTGKGMFAEFIHANSNRKNYPFIKIDCTSIPENLFESELFGYEGGSFTGAIRKGKAGLAELADRGTLFLDEIGELPLILQKKLLNLIQDKSFYRVGGNRKINIDVRIIAATNRDLEKMVREGAFREDLYYRVSVVPILLPPLRERKEDIRLLIHHFLAKYNKKYNMNTRFSPEAVLCMESYLYPGNIRELENTVERLVVTAVSSMIDVSSLPFEIKNAFQLHESTHILHGQSYSEAMAKFEKSYLLSVMQQCHSTKEMSDHLGIATNTITMKLKKHDIPICFKRKKKR